MVLRCLWGYIRAECMSAHALQLNEVFPNARDGRELVRKVLEAGRVTSAAEGPQIARRACVELRNRRGKEGA